MNWSTLISVIIGGFISLLTTIVVMYYNHKHEMKKLLRQQPSKILYEKQIQFFDSITPLYHNINNFITTLDVWLREEGDKSKIKFQDASKNTDCLDKLWELRDRYYLYLPETLLGKITKLVFDCYDLSQNPNAKQSYYCTNLLDDFYNSLREYIGIERLSEEFLQAFGPKKRSVLRSINLK